MVRKIAVSSLIVSLLALGSAHADFKQTASVPVEQRKNWRDLTLKTNPFLRPCVPTDALPTFGETTLTVEADAHRNMSLVTLRFKSPQATPILLLKKKDIELQTDSDGFYNISIARTGQNNKVTLFLVLKSESGRFRFRLEADVQGTTAALIPELTKEQEAKACLKNQVWAGYGGSAFNYQQSISSLDAGGDFTSLKMGSYHFEARFYPSANVGLIASYKNAPGQIKTDDTRPVEETSFSWKITEVGLQLRAQQWLYQIKDWGVLYPYLRAAIQHHQLPRLGVDNNETLFLDKLQFADGALGLGANFFTTESYYFESYLNLKYPIWETNAQIQPNGILFDGGVGVGMALTPHLTIGAYWYGHWEKLRYETQSGRDQTPGTLDFIFSNFDIRLGLLF